MALDRYSRPSKDIEEGIEGWVPYKGTVEEVVKELVAGLQAAFGYVGARNIREMWYKSKFGLVSQLGSQEIRPHNIYIPSKS